MLCHRVQRQHTESSGVLSGHGDQHAGQCTLPLAGQVSRLVRAGRSRINVGQSLQVKYKGELEITGLT